MSALRNTNVSVLARVNEQGTLKLEFVVTNDDGGAVTPTAFTYTLTDRGGTIINDLENEPKTPGYTITVTLAGDDLQILDPTNEREFRILTAKTDQDDVNLPLTIETRFWVENLVAVT